MRPGFSPRAILLDFYGTVVQDDEVIVARICSQVAAVSPLSVTAAEVLSYWGALWRQLCSESFGASFRSQKKVERLSLQRVLERFQADLDGHALCQMAYAYWAQPTIFPESKKVLAACRLPVCLVSNIDNGELYSALQHHDLHFDWIVTSQDCRAYKPRADMFEKALALLDLSADQVLHVGDSYGSDVRGARSVGIPVLWVNRKKRPLPLGHEAPDYVSEDLTGLLSIILG
jgi:HAD superfamily hydrolase (TIGR01493 family)